MKAYLFVGLDEHGFRLHIPDQRAGSLSQHRGGVSRADQVQLAIIFRVLQHLQRVREGVVPYQYAVATLPVLHTILTAGPMVLVSQELVGHLGVHRINLIIWQSSSRLPYIYMAAELKEIINSPALLKLVAQNAFQTMDVDNNGYIDFSEFSDMIRDMAVSLNVS